MCSSDLKRKDPFCIEKKGDNVRPFPPGGAPVTSSLSGSFQDPPTKPESNGPLRFAENGHGMFGVPTTRLTLCAAVRQSFLTGDGSSSGAKESVLRAPRRDRPDPTSLPGCPYVSPQEVPLQPATFFQNLREQPGEKFGSRALGRCCQADKGRSRPESV